MNPSRAAPGLTTVLIGMLGGFALISLHAWLLAKMPAGHPNLVWLGLVIIGSICIGRAVQRFAGIWWQQVLATAGIIGIYYLVLEVVVRHTMKI